MKRIFCITLVLVAAGLQIGCASLNSGDMACGPQHNGIRVFGNPEAYQVACRLR